MMFDFTIRLFGHSFRFCAAPVEAPVAVVDAPTDVPATTPEQVAPLPVEQPVKAKPGRKAGWQERQTAKREAAEKLRRLNEVRNANLVFARAAKAVKDAERKASKTAA